MNILKNFEALFAVTLGLACAANYMLDDSSATATQPATVAMAAIPASVQTMPVVVISAKRLSPEQKKQSLADEHKQLAVGSTATSSI